MDELLKYLLLRIALYILLIEFLCILLGCLLIVIVKFYNRWSEAKTKKDQDEISSIIQKTIFGKDDVHKIEIPSHFCDHNNLVEVLERYDRHFIDSRWVELKETIVKKYLVSKAKAAISSYFWIQRLLAARTFLLCPSIAQEDELRKLLNDSRYLVRVTAAVCITKTPYKKLFYEMLQKMKSETDLSQFPYRDALVSSSEQVFGWLKEILLTEKDPEIQAICLDAVSTRFSPDLFPILSSYLDSENKNCRIFAIKGLSNIPSPKTIEILENKLTDKEPDIRLETVKSLEKLYAVTSIDKLATVLRDPDWNVRLQAAMTLKGFGSQGLRILSEQQPKDHFAYQISQYALALH